MPAPLIPALLAGVRALITRAAVGVGTRALAAEGAEAIGTKLASKFIQQNIAPKAITAYRGVSDAALSSEFVAPKAGKEVFKDYVSSFAAAQKAAGPTGQVLKIELPRSNIAAYQPTPIKGAGTQYSVPFAEHSERARQVAQNPWQQFFGGRIGEGFKGFSSSPFQQATSSTGQSSSPFPQSMQAIQQSSSSSREFGGFPISGFQGNSGSNRFGGYTNAVRSWMANSTPGRLYSGLQNLAAWKPLPDQQPARVMPFEGGGPSYANISPSQLMGMAGQSQGQIAQTNAEAGANQSHQSKLQQHMQELDDVTQQVTKSFSDLVISSAKTALVWGSGAGPVAIGAGVTAATGASIKSDIDRYSSVSPAFARMEAQRRYQDLNLNRSVADSTSGSAQFLHEQQQEGERLLADIWKDLKPLINAGLGLFQMTVNAGLKAQEYLSVLSSFRQLGRAIDKYLGEGNPNQMNIPHQILEEARRGANNGKKQKAPLDPIG